MVTGLDRVKYVIQTKIVGGVLGHFRCQKRLGPLSVPQYHCKITWMIKFPVKFISIKTHEVFCLENVRNSFTDHESFLCYSTLNKIAVHILHVITLISHPSKSLFTFATFLPTFLLHACSLSPTYYL